MLFDVSDEAITTCPTTSALEAGLSAGGMVVPLKAGRVTHRIPNPTSSTFSTEIITVDDDSRRLVLFCKHGRDYVDPHGDIRRGVPYEAFMYSDVVDGAISVPGYFGSFSGAHGTTLVLEHLPRATSVAKTAYTADGPLANAVAALGEWHGRCQMSADGHVQHKADRAMNQYGATHLSLWARKAGVVGQGPLREYIDRGVIAQTVRHLQASQITLIHGELFPANVLVSDGDVRFVDWESAGFGAGEIDLAALTSGDWPAAILRDLEEVYVSSRWSDGPPPTFPAAMAAARLYILVTIAWHSRHARSDDDAARWAEQARSAVMALDH